MRAPSAAVAAFAGELGGVEAGPVVVVGGRSAFEVGGAVAAGTREVRAPAGIVEHLPAESTVRVLAGTPVADLQAALAPSGQQVALPARTPTSTVGGVLAVGRSGVRRLGWGPVRDTLLEATVVLADGRVAKGGGPTVKNVTGYDVCRLLVGSLGTLALLAEVVLRTRPVPATSRWFEAGAPEGWRQLHRPSAALWDGESTWVLLEGHPDDVVAQAAAAGLRPACDPPSLDGLPHRWSLPVAALPGLLAGDGDGPFVAELGVGVVHRDRPQRSRPVGPAARAVHDRLRASFDPTGRLAPGRTVLP